LIVMTELAETNRFQDLRLVVRGVGFEGFLNVAKGR